MPNIEPVPGKEPGKPGDLPMPDKDHPPVRPHDPANPDQVPDAPLPGPEIPHPAQVPDEFPPGPAGPPAIPLRAN